MDHLAWCCTGILIGFFSLFAVVAFAIRKDDKTPLRKTTGDFLSELGAIISTDAPNEDPYI